MVVEYDKDNYLSTTLAKNSSSRGAEVNLSSILEDSNTNLTTSQKLLIHWYSCFGHTSMARIWAFFRQFPFRSERSKAASRCVLPLCSTCQYAKAHRQPKKGSIKSANQNTNGAIRTNQLRTGNLVSCDHFESRLKGRTYESMEVYIQKHMLVAVSLWTPWALSYMWNINEAYLYLRPWEQNKTLKS